MLKENLPVAPRERPPSTEPFVSYNAKGILIGGLAGFPANLLRGHVMESARHLLGGEQIRRWRQQRQAKIAEQQLLLFTQQQVFWFDIAVDKVAAMSIVEGGCDLLDVGDDHCKRQW